MSSAKLHNAINIQDIIAHTARAKQLTSEKVQDIRNVTHMLKVLALNALIEANRAGEVGQGFSVVANEVKGISANVEELSATLAKELLGEFQSLESLTQTMAMQSQGARLIDLALNAVELIDRNLYERTCDVRWWATDAAMVSAAQEKTEEKKRFANQRLGVILDAYTVYRDIWLCDLDGNILASGNQKNYSVSGQNIAHHSWFTKARMLSNGNEFAVADIAAEHLLQGAQIATYATGVREGGNAHGQLLGILGVHFDWQHQAETIVKGIRLTPQERQRTRALLVDAAGLVLAASDDKGILTERIELPATKNNAGHYQGQNGEIIAFHRTPGYETYTGLGWYGVLIQHP